MAASVVMGTRVVRASKTKLALIVLACCGGVVLFSVLADEAGPLLPRPWAAGILAVLALAFGPSLARPSTVTLATDFFEIQGLWGKPSRFYWSEVESIGIWRNPAPKSFQRLVGWTLRRDASRSFGSGSKILRGVGWAMGMSGTLPPMMTLSVDDLHDLMLDYWRAEGTANDTGTFDPLAG